MLVACCIRATPVTVPCGPCRSVPYVGAEGIEPSTVSVSC